MNKAFLLILISISFYALPLAWAYDQANSALTPPAGQSAAYETALNEAFRKAEEIQSGKINLVEKLNLPYKKQVIISVPGVYRFLISGPKIISVSKVSGNDLQISGDDIGFSILHIWYAAGRKSIKIQVAPEKPPVEEQEKRFKAEEFAEPFRLHYYLNRRAFHSGPQPNMLERASLSVSQVFGLTGATPYGNIDTYGTLRKLNADEEWVRFTLGLTDGRTELFNDLDMRFFDTSADLNNLALPFAQVQGARIDAQEGDTTYTALFGQEKSGIFGALTPSSEEDRDSYLYATRLKYNFPDEGALSISLAGGWGGDRRRLGENINDRVVDAQSRFYTDDFDTETELAFDGEELAVLFNNTFKYDYSYFSAKYRDINRDYNTVVGRPNAQGEQGLKLDAAYYPDERFRLSAGSDFYRDRLFPNIQDPGQMNMDYYLQSANRLSETVSLNGELRFNDDQGRVSPAKNDLLSLQVNKSFPGEKKLDAYLNYQRYNSRNLSSPSLDFVNQKLVIGSYYRLLSDMAVGMSEELNWLKENELGQKTQPRSFLATMDYAKKFNDSPYSTALRLRYRNEAQSSSERSFMLGEDSLHTQWEVRYNPQPDVQAYLTSSWKKIWGNKESNPSRSEVELIMGANVVYDTIFRWDPQAEVEGVVFKDLNGNGNHDRGEKGIGGVKVRLGRKEITTNEYGRFKFGTVRAKKIYVAVETQTFPAGFVATTPISQSVEIMQNGRHIIRFGILGISEIRGFVYNDANLNSSRDSNERGLEKVKIYIDGKKEMITDSDGYYYLRNVEAGPHKVGIDIKTLPLNFIPTVPIQAEIKLFEGMTYSLNFPIRALRTISGRVYLDRNNNNSFDPGDEALSNLEVRLGSAKTLTNNNGDFMFKNLSAGEFILEINEPALPERLFLKKGRRNITLPLESVNISGEDFILGMKD